MSNKSNGGSVQSPDDALAVEFVMRTLNESETAQVESRIAEDADFAKCVASWRQRLQPLEEPIASEPPPERVWDKIAARINKPQP